MDTIWPMKLYLFFILFMFPLELCAQQGSTLCDIFNFPNCSGISRVSRRSSQQSLPSSATSASLNPANVSYDKGIGIGIEAIHQDKNSSIFNLSSGTEKIGGALINANLENSFFGNRTPEVDSERLKRQLDIQQFKTKKLTLALGNKLVKRKNLNLDLGLIFKYNPDIRKLNPGFGLSSKVGPLSIGASLYQDDFYINSSNYQERFYVMTYSAGARIGAMAFDVGVIKSKNAFYQDIENTINLYSIAYSYKNFLFNYGLRNEKGPFPKFVNNELISQETKTDSFGSMQFSIGRNLTFAINYNYFLLNELSLSTAVFF